MIISVALSIPESGPLGMVAGPTAVVLWAIVRLALLSVLLGPAGEHAVARDAWAWGLAPLCVALIPGLGWVGWAASAAITNRSLVRLGTPKMAATRTVVTVWIINAVIVIAAWLAQGALLAFLV